MAYFPHAYRKVFVPSNFAMATDKGTHELDKGEYGFFSTKTWKSVPIASANVAQNPQVMFVVGSTHKVDKIGSHGGYRESIKSKPIDPRHVHKFYRLGGSLGRNQVINLGYNGTDLKTIPHFENGKQYLLRIDLKGSPVLRFLTRNAYHTFDANTGCPDPCLEPCTPAAKVDPVTVFIQWAKQISEDPIYSNFIKPEVYVYDTTPLGTHVDIATYTPETDPVKIDAIKAGMMLVIAYYDTKFGNCSFDPRDHNELEPIQIYASLVDESGNPCNIPLLNVNEKQSTMSAEGSGETVLRDVILFNRYRQEPFSIDTRKREVEDIDAVSLDLIDRNFIYNCYYILHSVPRNSNPSGTLDSDQYLIQVAFRYGTDSTAFENWFQTYLDSAGTGVKLEKYDIPAHP
jgi:hypothetical protein